MPEEKKEEQIPKFQKTILTALIAGRVERGFYNFGGLPFVFDTYPTIEVRKAILKRLLDDQVRVIVHDINWIEQRINDLAKEQAEEKIDADPPLWKQMLEWYVFNAGAVRGDETGATERAIEFAIAIAKKDEFAGSHGFFFRSDILKIIIARIKRDPERYENMKAPSLKPFLESFLVDAYDPKFGPTYSQLVDVERIVRCLIKVWDASFLPHIEKVLARIYQNQEKNIKNRKNHYDFEEEVDTLQDQAFLKEAIRFFKEELPEMS